jgi:hypothetical protein
VRDFDFLNLSPVDRVRAEIARDRRHVRYCPRAEFVTRAGFEPAT